MLGVTRQFVDRLLANEVLACRRLPGSRHRHIRVQDVVAVGVERDARLAGHEALRTAIEDRRPARRSLIVAKIDKVFIGTSELFPFTIMEQHRLAASDSVTLSPLVGTGTRA